MRSKSFGFGASMMPVDNKVKLGQQDKVDLVILSLVSHSKKLANAEHKGSLLRSATEGAGYHKGYPGEDGLWQLPGRQGQGGAG